MYRDDMLHMIESIQHLIHSFIIYCKDNNLKQRLKRR